MFIDVRRHTQRSSDGTQTGTTVNHCLMVLGKRNHTFKNRMNMNYGIRSVAASADLNPWIDSALTTSDRNEFHRMTVRGKNEYL